MPVPLDSLGKSQGSPCVWVVVLPWSPLCLVYLFRLIGSSRWLLVLGQLIGIFGLATGLLLVGSLSLSLLAILRRVSLRGGQLS